jgi:hypothetical protein
MVAPLDPLPVNIANTGVRSQTVTGTAFNVVWITVGLMVLAPFILTSIAIVGCLVDVGSNVDVGRNATLQSITEQVENVHQVNLGDRFSSADSESLSNRDS